MILTLEVTGAQAQQLGAGHRKVFKDIGGTIGRLPDNDWVFQDPYVSGRHALIRYLNGKFFVEDTSTNGVFINSPENRLARGQPRELHDGDLLYIDAYKINVAIQNGPEADRTDALTLLKNSGPKLATPPKRASAPTPSPAVPHDDKQDDQQNDKTATLIAIRPPDIRNATVALDRDDEEEDDEEADDTLNGDHATEWFGANALIDQAKSEQKPSATTPLPPQRAQVPKPVAVQPPRPPSPDRRRPSPPAAKSPPAPATSRPSSGAAAASATDSQLQALFEAAGIEGLDPSTEAARTLGKMLRVALGGVMDALRTRERMKDDLRIRGTTFKAADNNPLKFSANVDDAFHNLLVKHNPAYLQPVDAFEEAFHDVRDHQAAFLAAMRLAFETMLSQFDPQRLQEEFDRQMKGSILGVPAKMRYWDLYRDKYGNLIKDAEAGFRALYGDIFARAYEEYLERLKQADRSVGQ